MTKSEAGVPGGERGYRPCVGIMVLNRDGLVWIGQRSDAPGDAEGRGAWWQMPQGGIDHGEDPERAALRELYEETGMRTVEVVARIPSWLTYDLPPELQGKAWGGRYRGQKQRWFLVRFTGSDDEINIAPGSGHEREFELLAMGACGGAHRAHRSVQAPGLRNGDCRVRTLGAADRGLSALAARQILSGSLRHVLNSARGFSKMPSNSKLAPSREPGNSFYSNYFRNA